MTYVVRQGMTWAVSGIVLGLLGAYVAAQAMATILVGVPPHDPLTFVTAGAGIAFVALVACAIPASRAIRINPMNAMRAD
jgi:ABC-type antimicrobial peptide transport system permease subunit